MQTHVGAQYLLKDCPDNTSEEQRKAKSAEEKAVEVRLKAAVAGKKTPTVRIADDSGDLDYTTDEEED